MSQSIPPPVHEPAPGDGLDRVFGWLRGLGVRRDTDDKWVAGVCSGVARRIGVDPILVRAAFLLLLCFGGFGLTAYLVCWALLPALNGDILAERGIRHGDGWALVLLVVAALSVFGGPVFAHDSGAWWVTGWLIPTAAVIWVVVRLSRGEPILPRQGVTPAHGTPGAPPTEGGPAPMTSAMNPLTTTPGAAGTEAPAPSASAPYAGQQAPGTPMPPGPGRAPDAYSAPRPRRRPGSGFAGVLTLGLAVLAYGVGLIARDSTTFPGSAHTLGLILALATVGAAVTVIGLLGRRGGFASVLGVVLAFATALTVVLPGVSWGDGLGDRTWVPASSVSDATYRLGAGDGTLDLRSLPTSPATPAHISVRQGVGNLAIDVPAGLTAEVNGRIGVGDVTVDGDQVLRRPNEDRDGDNGRTVTRTVGDGTPDVVVDAQLGLGSIIVTSGR